MMVVPSFLLRPFTSSMAGWCAALALFSPSLEVLDRYRQVSMFQPNAGDEILTVGRRREHSAGPAGA